MRIWVDTEFMEDGRTIDLLSVGMIREDGERLYLEADWADHTQANDWVKQHVLPHLVATREPWYDGGRRPSANLIVGRDEMRKRIVEFVESDPEFWAWFAAYDWVVLCQLFGRMVDLPSTWPMRINDIAQVAHMVGANRLPQQTSVKHNALADAIHARNIHYWLEQMYSGVLP